MKVRTETGSQYEIDYAAKRVRRLNSEAGTSERVGRGEWRSFVECSDPALGERLEIVWAALVTEPGIVLQCSVTSYVVAIEPLS